MATYTKKLKSIVVHTLLSDEAGNIPLADTTTDNVASRALADFLAYRDIVAKVEMQGQTATVSIPYHAVQYIEVQEEEATISPADPYGCEETEKGYKIKLCSEGEAPACYCADSPLKPITGDDMQTILNELCGGDPSAECIEQLNVTYDGETLSYNSQEGTWGNDKYTYELDEATDKFVVSSHSE